MSTITPIPFAVVDGFTPERLGELPDIANEQGGNAVLFRGMAAEQHPALAAFHTDFNRDVSDVNSPGNRAIIKGFLADSGWDVQGFADAQPSPHAGAPSLITDRVVAELITPRKKLGIPQFKAWHTDAQFFNDRQGNIRYVIMPYGWLVSINLISPVVFKVAADQEHAPACPPEVQPYHAEVIEKWHLRQLSFRGPERQHIVEMQPGDVIAVRQPAAHAVMPQLKAVPGTMRRSFTLTREDELLVKPTEIMY